MIFFSADTGQVQSWSFIMYTFSKTNILLNKTLKVSNQTLYVFINSLPLPPPPVNVELVRRPQTILFLITNVNLGGRGCENSLCNN